MAPKKAASSGGAGSSARCPVQGCRMRLTPGVATRCKTCNKEVCTEHQFPLDHNCAGSPAAAAPAPASLGSLGIMKPGAAAPALSVVKPVATGGLGIVKPTVAPAAAPSAAESFPALAKSVGVSVEAPVAAAAATAPTATFPEAFLALKTAYTASADQVYAELVQAAAKGKAGSKLVAALEAMQQALVTPTATRETPILVETAKEIELLEIVRALASRVATGADVASATAGLEANVADPKASLTRRGASALLLGAISGRRTDDAVVFGACELLARVSMGLPQAASLTARGSPEDAFRRSTALAIAEALRFKRVDTDLSEHAHCLSIIKAHLAILRDASSSAFTQRGAAMVLAGVARGAGAPDSLEALKFTTMFPVGAGFAAIKDERGEVIPGLILASACAFVCGRSFEPYALGNTLVNLTTRYKSQDPEVRKHVLLAGHSLTLHTLGPLGGEVYAKALERGMRESAWRVKELSLELFISLVASSSTSNPRAGVSASFVLEANLPTIVPCLASCVVDSKKEVSNLASEALDAVGETVTNPETRKLMPHILEAIKRPDEGTDNCLAELMDATFVNTLNATSVALIVPVLTRALREGSADLKRRGAIATGNVCALVRDVDDMRPFADVLNAELTKLREHSSPPVRKGAVTALKSLEKALNGGSLRNSSRKSNSPRAGPVVLSPKSGPLSPRAAPVVNPLVASAKIATEAYDEATSKGLTSFHALQKAFCIAALAFCARKFVYELGVGASSLARVTSELKEACGETITSRDLEILAVALHSKVRKARSKSIEAFDLAQEIEAKEGKDPILVDLAGMILAFASRVLLYKTNLRLRQGHRYGIVGKIGVGKTTLASRLARGDVEGFPENVKTYMVLHEVGEEGVGKSAVEYMGGTDLARDTLLKVGFKDVNIQVSALSGGWRMRLAIARSMLANADLLVLDEPTNHVDVDGVKWLADYLMNIKNTIVVVSHDYEFLSTICTDIVHLHDQKLDTFEGTFTEFQKEFPEIAAGLPRMGGGHTPAETPVPSGTPVENGAAPTEAAASSEGGMDIFELLQRSEAGDTSVNEHMALRGIPTIAFPDPGKLEGVSSKGKPIMTATNLTFAYPSDKNKVVLKNINCRLSLNSRVALRGANGQGKSTLLKLLIGELELNPEEGGNQGTLWKHHNLRVAYVAQHAAHHLEDCLDTTPIAYLQRRYFEGRDKERGQMVTMALTEEEKAIASERGEICGILSRVVRGKTLYYEIDVAGRRRDGGRQTGRPGEGRDAKDFRSLPQLEAMNKPHVLKLVRMFDEELKYEASGMSIRPVNQIEILKHLADFGISEDFAERKIRWLSGGQRSRLVLAAAMWHKPHLVALDEPTNFLDAETLAVLTHCLRTFKGAVLTVSHHQSFVAVLCNEAWDMKDGELTKVVLREKFKVGGNANEDE